MGKNNDLNNITYPVYKKLVKRASVVYPVDNIANMSDNDINNLKAGDVVVKKTGNQRHAYVVSYKEDGQGICLTYVDGSGYMETISYDYTGGHWVYNSKDVTQVPSKSDIISDINGEDINPKNVSATGSITGDEIVENMSGYAFTKDSNLPEGVSFAYVGCVKNGNKITFVTCVNINFTSVPVNPFNIGIFSIPESVGSKLFPSITGTSYIDLKSVPFAKTGYSYDTINMRLTKVSDTAVQVNIIPDGLLANVSYSGRYEVTLLLSDSLVSA